GIVESDSEVELVFDDVANLGIPTSGNDICDKGYGTNSLLEQWRDSYPNKDDYDPYDDDMYENHDLSEHLQSICDDLDITCVGHGPQPEPTYRYNFKSFVSEETTTTINSFFTPIDDAIVGHECTKLVRKLGIRDAQQIPPEIVALEGKKHTCVELGLEDVGDDDDPTFHLAKVTTIEEAKELATLPLDELIFNLKVYEMILASDGVASKPIKEKVMPIALKANLFKKGSSFDRENRFGNGRDRFDRGHGNRSKGVGSSRGKRNCYGCGSKNHFVDDCPKEKMKKAFFGEA
ncbi:putative ribonuclease H-like domain-containing protein, partial [Tanacetum coccineum]